MTFNELVDSYKTGKTSFEDLILEVRCESCFTSVFKEAQQQLEADSQILDMLADEFPIYHTRTSSKSKIKVLNHENLSNHKSWLKSGSAIA